MTTAELDALEPGTIIYLPTDWDVTEWRFAGRVYDRSSYTFLHPPDKDGVIVKRNPVYFDATVLLNATLDKRKAWYMVLATLADRREWIYKRKLISG